MTAKDERIRKACAEEQLAIVFLQTGLGSIDIQKVLDDLAKASSYRELEAFAPLCFIGHSAGRPQAKTAAVKTADRCFGVMQYRGSYFRRTQHRPQTVRAPARSYS